ncbi:hypothetical protein [Actinoalloteichus sp. GBA129-24]|uniref:Uncharacterized protein n=1 Tax=Actinoalloteichus fjordicus TaxID=1612552 RepID=A0AAC9PRK9_9PSEU|nr:hypothetical protein [Actinoalloteichus sp. GBA129-24]APU14062.1 hypothetical protein UA74_09995 [Actinoalloteichus fjordicus]APU20009.1 hypothetical protein UA75_09970 [Actinoalloteichus sp. GBA129-24]
MVQYHSFGWTHHGGERMSVVLLILSMFGAWYAVLHIYWAVSR